MAEDESKDFFISYNKADRNWAEWIAFELEAAHYTTIIQAWDMRPGSNFVSEMDEATKRAERTIPVLSPAYLTSDYAFAEWAAAFRHDPKGKLGKVLPVRIEQCVVEGLLGPIVYIDFVDLDESQAREHLLTGVKQGRAKPASVAFPRSSTHSVPLDHPAFPGSQPQRQDVPLEKSGTRPMGHEQVWNVPYPRNPVFTGREPLLAKLVEALHTDNAAALTQPQALSGLGGIGKTQIALEYAYRFQSNYLAVLWVQADTHENLTSSYLTLAALLDLPEKDEQESAIVIAAVKNWLQRTSNWLLILDNADELTLLPDFLPPRMGGKVILTTRAQAPGRFAHRVEVDTFSTERGALFLLQRIGLLAPDAPLEHASEDEQHGARAICEHLGGLPLALDQAGAYIEETGCSLAEYEQLFQHRRADLLAERRGSLVNDHPASVATTWSLSFERVKQKSPAAADLLRLCAFLAPDAIPETIILQGAKYLGEHLALVGEDHYLLNQAIEVLRAYSLLSREVRPAASSLSVHRLVQAVLKDQMNEQEKHQWGERTIRAIEAALPAVDHQRWAQWEQILPQTLHCQELIEQNPLLCVEATGLLQQTGWYLTERIRYREAEHFLKQALAISKQEQGLDHPSTARSLNNLASLYIKQGKHAEAEPLYVRALAISEQQLGSEHPDTARSLNNLAFLYTEQGKYAEAEPLLVRTLRISEQQLGTEHLNTAISLNNLASLYIKQGKYVEVEPLYMRALAIREQQLGVLHPSTASSLDSLASLYIKQGKYVKAEPLLVWALVIKEQQLGALHPDTALSLNNLASLYIKQGKYVEVEPLLVRALRISEQQLGTEHLNTAISLNNLAFLYTEQGKYGEAEPLLVRALAIKEQQLGALHPDTAQSLNNLAVLYTKQGKYAEAELLYVRALAISEQQLGALHPDTAQSLNNLALLYTRQGKYGEAEPLYVQALAIREQQLGALHPDTQTVRTNYAFLLQAMGRDGEAR